MKTSAQHFLIWSLNSLSCLSHAALRYLLPHNCACEHLPKKQQYTHLDLVCSLCLGRVSHPLHNQPRCSDHQHPKVHICWFMCPHPRRHVRRIRRPRECALCAVFIPPHSLLAFPLAALQSTLVVLECQAQHLLPGFVALIATVYCIWLVPI